jgi:hypothetical protein
MVMVADLSCHFWNMLPVRTMCGKSVLEFHMEPPMALTKGKRNLVEKKESWGLKGTIEKTDIVGLVTYAWEHSFARQDTNKKAVAERGWGPLNYNILLHPEINSNKSSDNVLTSDAKQEDLNLVAGIAGILTNKILMFRNREAARTGENAAEVLRQ